MPEGDDMAQTRRAEAHWSGDLASGDGGVTAATSGIFTDVPTSWRARTEASEGKTSPEELLATAHASCYSMAVSNELSKAGFVPTRVDVVVEVDADRAEKGWTVQRSRIQLRAAVPGIDEETFHRVAALAKDGCPISRAIAGNVALEVDAALVP
jgi:osmotically inducible protein OsmC